MGKSAPSPPPAPDYASQARETQKSQMSSQYTPYGQSVYSPESGSPSGYRQDITMNPEQQGTLDQLMKNYGQVAGMAGEQLGNFNANPMDLSSVQDVADKTYGYQTARLDPQWQQMEQQKEAQLRNQGMVAGGEGYNNAMNVFGQQRNDAYTQARLAAEQTKPQTFELANAIKNQPLNYYAALMNQAPVQNPTFTPQPGANYMGAAQAQNQYDMKLYNSRVGNQNSMMSGLFSLGAAGVPFLFG